MAALSPHAPVRPIDPIKPLRCNAFTNFFERNWLPRSECTIVPAGSRSADTARDAFIRSSML